MVNEELKKYRSFKESADVVVNKDRVKKIVTKKVIKRYTTDGIEYKKID